VPFRFTATVDAVHLNISVVNKEGRLITDLSREDFMVIEDNIHQKIVYFAHGEDAPFDLVLLVDASGSMELTEKATNARNAAIQLIHSLGPEDRVSVYAFDRDVYQLTFPLVNTAVGISNSAFPMNASDRLWAKYGLGERSKIIDPTTMKPAVRNIFLDGSTMSVKAMQARGTVFWQCNIALGVVAQRLAQATGMPVTEVRADLLAGLNPGVRLVPSHVMALGLAQERGFTYMKA